MLRKSGDHARIFNDPTVVKQWRLDQVITSDLFDLPSARLPEVETLLNRRRQLVEQQARSVGERQELAELDRRVRELPTAEVPKDQNAMDIIRRAATKLQQSR